jgi:hypothetical protein
MRGAAGTKTSAPARPASQNVKLSPVAKALFRPSDPSDLRLSSSLRVKNTRLPIPKSYVTVPRP